ncbi:MAG: GNAT family N-acetyltransferase [Caldilineaceae bacterium]|nr:GNAT family N-acetyltransferase [Caldilineaceae bacterium]
MIRRLGEADRFGTIALLEAAPILNLYLLGNLDAHGFGEEFCEFWGDVVDGRVHGVINRYMTGWTVFGEASADWAGLGQVIDHHAVVAERLQDNPGGVPSLLPYLQRYEAAHVSEEVLMALPADGLQRQPPPDGFVVRRATLDDLAALVAFFADAGKMSRSAAGIELPLRDRRVWIALQGGEVVSAALTNAETERLAMVGGVYTAPAWRGRGLSRAVCSALCDELIQTGRQPALYWDNPVAGRVYAKIGFRAIGIWRSLRLSPVVR